MHLSPYKLIKIKDSKKRKLFYQNSYNFAAYISDQITYIRLDFFGSILCMIQIII